MKPITDTELSALLVDVHDGTRGSYAENLRAGVNKLLEQRAAEAAPEVTEADLQAMALAWETGTHPYSYAGMRQAAEALAKRWGPRTTYRLSPEVTAELERLIREMKE